MNDSDGTMTSSPGPTPAATSARCRAVVQEETATACAAPIDEANAASNSATRGPWATHPEETAAPASRTPVLSAPVSGRPLRAAPLSLRAFRLPLLPPPGHQPPKAVVQSDR